MCCWTAKNQIFYYTGGIVSQPIWLGQTTCKLSTVSVLIKLLNKWIYFDFFLSVIFDYLLISFGIEHIKKMERLQIKQQQQLQQNLENEEKEEREGTVEEKSVFENSGEPFHLKSCKM